MLKESYSIIAYQQGSCRKATAKVCWKATAKICRYSIILLQLQNLPLPEFYNHIYTYVYLTCHWAWHFFGVWNCLLDKSPLADFRSCISFARVGSGTNLFLGAGFLATHFGRTAGPPLDDGSSAWWSACHFFCTVCVCVCFFCLACTGGSGPAPLWADCAACHSFCCFSPMVGVACGAYMGFLIVF